MKVRHFVFLMVLALLVALIPAASAQDAMCFNLSAADCETLTAAQANSANITSSGISFSLDLSVTGLDQLDAGTGDITVSASGDGSWSFDIAQVDNPMQGVSAAMDFQLSISGAGNDESIAFSFVVADGVVYFQDPESQQWFSMSMEQAMGMSGMPFSPEMFTNPAAMAGMAGGMGDMSAFNDLANVPGFISMERGSDTTVGGVNASPFTTNVDFLPLLTSPEFGEILGMAMGAMSGGTGTTPGMDGAQLAQMIPMMIGDSTASLKLTQFVGTDDNFLHGLRWKPMSALTRRACCCNQCWHRRVAV
jgi:hypothetical protein